MEENRKILEALRKLSPLLQKEKEWGGRVNLYTGEIKGLREGEETTLSMNPKEERQKGTEGWRGFHAHPTVKDRSSLPSVYDFLATHLCGTPNYVLTGRGIWEIRPLRVLPLDEVMRIIREALSEAMAVCGRENPLAYQYWEDKVRKAIPVEVSLFEWSEEPAGINE